MCAHAVRVALEKIDGVTDVTVSLNDGAATLAFDAGNTVSVTQVWGAIRRNGFTPREAHVQVRGRIEAGAAGPELRVAAAGLRFALTVTPELRSRLERLAGDATVLIDGIVDAPERREGAAALRLRVVQFAVEEPAR